MKRCSKCKDEKDVNLFSKNKSTKDGLRNRCKDCDKEDASQRKEYYKNYCISKKESILVSRKKYYEKNKERINEYQHNWRKKNSTRIKENRVRNEKLNPEKYKQKRKESYIRNKENIIIKNKEYVLKNKEAVKKRKQEWELKNKEILAKKRREKYLLNKEDMRLRQREYRLKNKDKRNQYERQKNIEDPFYKFKNNVRKLISYTFKNNKLKKPSKTEILLGCTVEEFKEYIQSKFTEGMTFKNHSKNGWHLDHIIPISSAKTEEELIKLNHYTNFQPLWAEDNLKKGNKIL
jgi:hypothetical protein